LHLLNFRDNPFQGYEVGWPSYPTCGVRCGVARGLGERLGNLKLCCPHFGKVPSMQRLLSVTRDEFELV